MFFWIYIVPSLMMSPMITLSLNSLFSMWMIMELNLMSFISFIIILNKFYNEVSVKYFIIQSFSSMIFIFFSNIIQFKSFMNYELYYIFINISLFIKVGSPPFHQWFISMMNQLNWISCLILSTFQKFIPLMILSYIYEIKLILCFSLLSCLIGSMYGINYSNLRTILAYSSINHLGWLLILISINEIMFILYFFSYFLINLSIFLIFNKLKLFYINNLNQIYFPNGFKFFLIMNLFSISSLPPMLGLLLKWYSMIWLLKLDMVLILMFMLILSVFSFLYYMRMNFMFLIFFTSINKMNLMFKFKKIFSFKFKFMIMSFLNLWIISMWLI